MGKRRDKLKNVALTMLQCDRFHVVGVCVKTRGWFKPKAWRITEALGVRAQGASFALDTLPGGEVTVVANDFPAMVTEILPGTPSHTSILKAYGDLDRATSAKAAGIVLPGEEN